MLPPMRIIAGSARSRRLKAPSGAATRPTADRVREAIFNILGPPPADTAVLDLFAGSGAMAFEALSRGAARAVAVDAAPAPIQCVRDNARSLDMLDRIEIIAAPALRALDRLAAANRRFDWVFVDPPYRSHQADAALSRLGRGDLLSDVAVVVVEHDRRTRAGDANGVLDLRDRRSYGDTEVSFYGRVRA
jgi:16S rRNA (guanine(966)-N(2))-methyltransferase RsmD